MKAKTGLPQVDPFPIRAAFDHDRHTCRPNPIECGACHGDGTGGLPA